VVGLFVPAGRSIISSHHTRQATTTRAAGRQDNSFDIYGKSPARHTSTRPQIIIPSRLLDDVEFLSKLVSGQPALLENRLKAPVAKGLCYRFFLNRYLQSGTRCKGSLLPVFLNRYLQSGTRVKQSVPKPLKFTQNILFGWDLNSRPLTSRIAPLPSQLHSCSAREEDIFLLK